MVIPCSMHPATQCSLPLYGQQNVRLVVEGGTCIHAHHESPLTGMPTGSPNIDSHHLCNHEYRVTWMHRHMCTSMHTMTCNAVQSRCKTIPLNRVLADHIWHQQYICHPRCWVSRDPILGDIIRFPHCRGRRGVSQARCLLPQGRWVSPPPPIDTSWEHLGTWGLHDACNESPPPPGNKVW